MGKQNRDALAMSRRRRNGLIWACIAAVATVAWLDRRHVNHEQIGRKSSEALQRLHDAECYHGKNFTVVRAVDGDTLDIDFPDGENAHTRIRLLGIDTPETRGDNGSEYFSSQATQAAGDLVTGQEVRIYLDEDDRTRGYYGRLLAYVQLLDGRFLNEVLLSEGFAYADLRFRHSLYNRYKQLEAGARAAGKGLWAGVSREQLPEWLQKERPSLLAK